jgi:hypothetical protein
MPKRSPWRSTPNRVHRHYTANTFQREYQEPGTEGRRLRQECAPLDSRNR